MASGLFARHGFDVELVAPVRGCVAGGPSPPAVPPDFALAAVHGHLAALAAGRDLGSRFVAAVHQCSPLAAFVALESPLRRPADLDGRRVAASTVPWFDHEYRQGLLDLCLRPGPVIQPHPSGQRPSLATGDVDVIGSWAESIAPLRRRAGIPVRSIAFGQPIYTTGVVAADRLAAGVVERMLTALGEAYAQQRALPTIGAGDLCRRFPKVAATDAVEEWGLLAPYLFGHGPALAMDSRRWQDTLAHGARAHGFTGVALSGLCRGQPLVALAGAS